jgi:hypothetical protein
MDRRRYELRRRDVARMLLALSAAPALVHAGEEKKDATSPLAEFLAGQETGLSPAEQAALKKAVVGLEKSLEAIRNFELPPNAAPSVRFEALRSRSR